MAVTSLERKAHPLARRPAGDDEVRTRASLGDRRLDRRPFRVVETANGRTGAEKADSFIRREIVAWGEAAVIVVVVCIAILLALGMPVLFLRLLSEALIRLITW